MLTRKSNSDETAVLYVENDDLTRRSVGRQLARHGIQVLEAQSGEQALELVKSQPGLSALLLDLELPGIDGVETYRRLRQSYPELPTVICSAHLTPVCRQRLAELGIPQDCLLQKPCPFSKLLAAIEEVVDRKSEPNP